MSSPLAGGFDPGPDGGVDLSFADQPGKSTSGEIRPDQSTVLKTHSLQVRACELRARQVGALELGTGQPGASKVSPRQVEIVQNDARQTRARSDKTHEFFCRKVFAVVVEPGRVRGKRGCQHRARPEHDDRGRPLEQRLCLLGWQLRRGQGLDLVFLGAQ